MKKTIIITGAAGMVGSNLIKKINSKKNIIIAIDNLLLGKKKFIIANLNKKNFFFFKYDLSKKINSPNILKIIKKNPISEIWLLAANSDIQRGSRNHKVDFKNTFLSTVNSMEFFKKYIKKDTKIIFTSSSAIYGQTNLSISENTKKKIPVSNYGLMKLKAEIYLSKLSKLMEFNIFIFRFPNVIGPNLTHGILYDMKKKILSKKKYIQVLGNGEQQKPYSHVSEIINCIFFIKRKIFRKKLNFFNIGSSDNGVKVKYIVNKIVKKFSSTKEIRYQKKKLGWRGDVAKYKYTTKKINRLGFKFKLNSKKTIDTTIKNI